MLLVLALTGAIGGFGTGAQQSGLLSGGPALAGSPIVAFVLDGFDLQLHAIGGNGEDFEARHDDIAGFGLKGRVLVG